MSEKVKIKIARNVVHLPAIALRGLVVFPNNVVHFEVGRTKSIAAIEAAMHANISFGQRGVKFPSFFRQLTACAAPRMPPHRRRPHSANPRRAASGS